MKSEVSFCCAKSPLCCLVMMDTLITTGTPEGGWKQLLPAKRASEATIDFVVGADDGRLGIDILKDFGFG